MKEQRNLQKKQQYIADKIKRQLEGGIEQEGGNEDGDGDNVHSEDDGYDVYNDNNISSSNGSVNGVDIDTDDGNEDMDNSNNDDVDDNDNGLDPATPNGANG